MHIHARKAHARGGRFRRPIPGESKSVDATFDPGRESTMRRGRQAVRRERTTVSECTRQAVAIAHHQHPLGTDVDAEKIADGRDLPAMTDDLPGPVEQFVFFPRQQAGILETPAGERTVGIAIVDTSPIFGLGERAAGRKLTRKDRAQIGHTAMFCRRAVDRDLVLKREALPENLEHADQAQRDAIGVELRLARIGDQALDQRAHERGKALVLLTANVVVFLARGRFSPEGVPDRNLAGTGNIRVEIEIDQQLERGDGPGLEALDRHEDAFLEFRGEEIERGDQHRRLRIEIEADDARRHLGDRHDFLDRRA